MKSGLELMREKNGRSGDRTHAGSHEPWCPAEREPLLNFAQPGAVRRTEASRATPCRRTLTTIRGTAVIQGFYAGIFNNKLLGSFLASRTLINFPAPENFSGNLIFWTLINFGPRRGGSGRLPDSVAAGWVLDANSLTL